MHSALVLSFSLASMLAHALPLQPRSAGVVVASGSGGASGSSSNGTSAARPDGVSTGTSATDSYTYYVGSGSASAGWPSRSKWASFESLWSANVPNMQSSCANNAWGADDSATELAAIKAAIQSQASASKVDARFILAIMMQESGGCVRVPTTNNGQTNPGLMQSADGQGTCAGVSPCPSSEISQMVADGTSGTASGDGLSANINQARTQLGKGAGTQSYYAAARIYNSGSVDWTNLDDAKGATGCYCSDVANRLTGWVSAPSTCTAAN